MEVSDRVVVVGSTDSFEDDVVIALNGQDVMSLPAFHEINFQGVSDRTEGVRADKKRRNINVTYGYAKQGFEEECDEDGLHPPSLLVNANNKPLIGKQYVALSKFITQFDPEEKQYDRSSNLFQYRNKFAKFALEATGHVPPDGAINLIENFSDIRNDLDLSRLAETKHDPPCGAHFDSGNSGMDRFSSFFSVSKTEYNEEARTVCRLANTGFNKISVDNLMAQKVIADKAHILVGEVEPSSAIVDSLCSLLSEQSLRYERAGIPRSELFTANAGPNISSFDSLLTHSFLSVLEKHGNSLPLVAELSSALFLTNGNDKAYYAFKHLEELERLPKDNLTMYFANWCNEEFGSTFSSGKHQRFRPATQNPYGLPVAIVNNLVIRDIVISANDEGESFSQSMEKLKKKAHGVKTVLGPRALRVLSSAGCIVPNEYAVSAELSMKLAKQVRVCIQHVPSQSSCGSKRALFLTRLSL